MLRVGYDFTEQALVVDLDELRNAHTALANNDKPLWVQLHAAENGELGTVYWVAPAAYAIDLFDDNRILISASNIDDGGRVEVMNLGWYPESTAISGGFNTYQLTASN